MCQFAQNTTEEAFQQIVNKGHFFTAIASFVRKALVKSYGAGWCVVVGKHFGAFVTHEIKTYFYAQAVSITAVLSRR